jgi:hypothetical protein
MTVAADHNGESGPPGLEVQLCQIVQHVDGNAGQFKRLGLRQMARPRTLVDVATYGGDRSNRGKLFENLGRADIPGINDVFRPAQSFDCLVAQQTVRVGDDAD